MSSPFAKKFGDYASLAASLLNKTISQKELIVTFKV